MAIKSLEELRAVRASLKNLVDLRENGVSTEGTIEVLVGMGTSGIATGANDTFNALLEVLETKQIENVDVIKVGDLGQSILEPTVQINIPGRKPVIYGKMTEDKVDELVQKVIVENGHLSDDLVIPTFVKAEVK